MRRFYFFGILLQVCYRLNVVVVFVVVVIICIFVQEVVAHFSPLNTCWKTGLQPLVITVCIQLTKVWSAKMRFGTVSLDGLTKIRIKHIIWCFFYSLPYSLKPKKTSLFLCSDRVEKICNGCQYKIQTEKLERILYHLLYAENSHVLIHSER